jgi:O-antigen biosynthesis protein
VNENAAYIFDIEEPTSWVFTGEPKWISGWFLSKTGAVFSDIRAVIEGIPYSGALGLPRPEIETRYRSYTGLPHAGFLLRVLPPRGARMLRLEILDEGNNWVEIWRTKIRVSRGQNTIGRFNLGVLPHQMRRLLQAHRANPAAELPALARRLALEAATVPMDTLPNPPFYGALERPEVVGGTQFGKVRLEGWLIHEHQKIHRLIASTHPQVEHEIDYGARPRPDAAQLFPRHPYAPLSQYFGMLDIEEDAPGPAVIKLWAELEDGTRHLVFIRRFHPQVSSDWEQPLPAFSRREFFHCARLLVNASRTQRICMGHLRDRWRAFASAYRMFRRDAPMRVCAERPLDPYVEWQHANRLTPPVREALCATLKRVQDADAPKISLVVDARQSSGGQLRRLTNSLQAQIYPYWDACFVGGAPFACGDPRIRFVPCPQQSEFLTKLNDAAHAAPGKLLAFLPGHSQLSPDAWFEVAERFAANRALELIYTDEDRIDESGKQSAPFFKPAWSPALALSGLFPGQLALVRKDRFVALGGLREKLDRVPWFDVLLRVSERLTAERVAHVPLICHHGCGEVSEELDLSDPAYEQARAALEDAARRRGWAADPFLPASGHHRQRCFQQVRWRADFLQENPVTIVIPTRDRLHLLQECVELLEETVDWRFAKLVIVDDHSRDADAVRYLERIQRRTDLRCVVVRPPNPHAPFNYSRLVNAALPHLDTPLVLHLNNDVNALERGWLEEMAGWFTQPDIGAVGAKLVFPDKTLNHTGIVIGPHGGLADTPFARVPEGQVDVRWHAAAREVSAVTGACLLTRTELYRSLGGFDETDFGVAYNDVDYCLRVRAKGLRVIYTPQAQLMHWGSATRGVTFDEAEHVAWIRRYPRYVDPYFSSNLALVGSQVACRGAHFVRTQRAPALRLLLLTHNLNLEGAPLFLLEYATWMVRNAGFSLEVLSAQDGPLRGAYETLGARLTIAETDVLFASPDEEIFDGRLLDLAHQVDWDRVDLVVCNTLMSFWGVLMARRAHKPSLFYIHESTSVFRFFEPKLEIALHRLVHEALGSATRTLFLCDATRRYYADSERSGNYRIVPSWIQLDQIAAFKAVHSREEMRRKHGFRDDEIVIANIGTVCERKGQHIFIRAIERFNRLHASDGAVRFVMVGARPGIYLDLLKRDLARLGLKNVTLVTETREVFDFFVASDMFVCTSYEESFPRVVMEAMGFGTPIVSTDVHGIAELIGQRQDGYLFKAGDVDGLVRMMHTCLSKERSGKSLAPTAYSKVLRHCDATTVLPSHADLAREAFLAHE